MHEHEHSKINRYFGQVALPAVSTTRLVTRWMRRRMVRNVYVGLIFSSLTAVGACCHSVFAESQFHSLDHGTASTDAREMAASLLGIDSADSTPLTFQQQWTNSLNTIHVVAAAPAHSSQGSDIYQVEEKRQETIPFKRVIHLSQNEPTGQTRLRSTGSNGILEKTFGVTYRGSQPFKYVLMSQRVVKKPVDMELMAGYTDRAARALPSRSGIYNRGQELDMVATGYSPYEGSGVGRCANGMRAGYGVVAVDPRVIPLGSRLYVEGYGYAFAGDTGGAIRGRRIDLGLNSYRAANDIGRRTVHVYVLSDK